VVLPIRATAADEIEGLDVTQHGEEAYIHDGRMAVPVGLEPTPAVASRLVAEPASSRY